MPVPYPCSCANGGAIAAPRRRQLAQAAACTAAQMLLPAQAQPVAPWLPQAWPGESPRAQRRAAPPRGLWVTRPQTGESVRAVYWADGALQREGYAALNHLYRDIHAQLQWPIALRLLDLNLAMQQALYRQLRPRPLVLFSGYRTAATNARVGGTRPNVHGLGWADDFIYEGLSLQDNYRLARAFQVGGLGLYPDRGSLHKDIGRWRSWVTPGRGEGAGVGGAVRAGS